MKMPAILSGFISLLPKIAGIRSDLMWDEVIRSDLEHIDVMDEILTDATHIHHTETHIPRICTVQQHISWKQELNIRYACNDTIISAYFHT